MKDTFDLYLYLSYTLVIIAAVAAIVLPLINSLGNPKTLLKSGLGVIGLAALFFIAYAVSDNEVTQKYTEFNVGPELSKFVGGSLILMYILIAGAVVSIVVTELSKIFK